MPNHPILAPPVELRELAPSQEAKLTDLLAQGLDDAEAAHLLDAIKEWFLLDLPNKSDADLVESMRHFEAERWGTIASLTRELHRELTQSSPPLVDPNGIPFAEYDAFSLIGGGYHLEWLARLAETAKAYAAAPERRKRPLEWRDELVALVIAHYPSTKIAFGQDSHFEKTVGLLLGFLGARLEPESLHTTINRIRRRGVDAPFVVADDPAT